MGKPVPSAAAIEQPRRRDPSLYILIILVLALLLVAVCLFYDRREKVQLRIAASSLKRAIASKPSLLCRWPARFKVRSRRFRVPASERPKSPIWWCRMRSSKTALRASRLVSKVPQRRKLKG